MEKESCESCANAFPCQKYCGECGKLLNPKFPVNPHCHFSHLGYKSEGGHKFCPNCGESLTTDDKTATMVSVTTRQRSKGGSYSRKSLEESKLFVEINICPQCQSPNFERIYGGRHNKQCIKCSKYFEENASMLEHLTR